MTTIPGQNIAQDIVRHATANNFTHIVIGRPTRSRWRELIEGSLTYDLIRNAGDISVHVISGTERNTEASSRRVNAAAEQSQFQIRPYLLATACILGSLAVSAVLDPFLDVRNLAIIFLLGVLTSAVTCGLWPALYACLVSALAFNFFFLEPRYTLTIRDPESIVALGVFLVVAVIVNAGIIGCGGGNQSSTESTTNTSSTPAVETPADTGSTGASASGGDVAAGERIYKQRCVLCHGPEGKGDGPGAAALNPKPRNHTDASYMSTQTDEQLLHSIREGKGQMPAWGKILTEEEMHSVLAYIRTLAK